MGDGGFANLADEVAKLFIVIMQKIFSAFVSIFAGLIPRKNPKKTIEKADFMAKNPPANIDVTSIERRGVFFGKQASRYIIKSEEMDGHVLVVGTPGSGKSSCIAIPTLKNWKGAVFAVDIKGELHANTHQNRPKVKLFEPQNKNCRYYYDPYFFLKDSDNKAQEARAIAQAVIPMPIDVREPFWIEIAQLILTSAILHYSDLKCSFIDTLKNIQTQDPKTLITLLSKSHVDSAKLCVNSFVGLEGKTLAGVSAEISRAVTAIITDKELITALTWESKKELLTPLDLENGSDIYIKIPEHLLKQWKNFLTLMTNQFITFFQKRGESKTNRPILFLLDEFPRLGKIPDITDALATLRSKKITICLIVQSLAQLEMIYGREARKVIADTCAFKAVLGATDADTQEYFSKLVGTYGKIRTAYTQNKNQYGAYSGGNTSFSEDNEKRIIKPEEFAYLREIILLYPLPVNFCRVEKQPYYLVR